LQRGKKGKGALTADRPSPYSIDFDITPFISTGARPGKGFRKKKKGGGLAAATRLYYTLSLSNAQQKMGRGKKSKRGKDGPTSGGLLDDSLELGDRAKGGEGEEGREIPRKRRGRGGRKGGTDAQAFFQLFYPFPPLRRCRLEGGKKRGRGDQRKKKEEGTAELRLRGFTSYTLYITSTSTCTGGKEKKGRKTSRRKGKKGGERGRDGSRRPFFPIVTFNSLTSGLLYSSYWNGAQRKEKKGIFPGRKKGEDTEAR